MGLNKLAVIGMIFFCVTAAQAKGHKKSKVEKHAKEEVTTAVQTLFNAMAAHDGAAIKAAFLEDARLVAVGLDGKATVSTVDSFATRIGGSKQAYLERMWEPRVQVRGAIAELWAMYDFHVDYKFSHCGIDSVSLVKVDKAWKIAGLSFTRENVNCPANPAGPVTAPAK
jgi:hypothetical protein